MERGEGSTRPVDEIYCMTHIRDIRCIHRGVYTPYLNQDSKDIDAIEVCPPQREKSAKAEKQIERIMWHFFYYQLTDSIHRG